MFPLKFFKWFDYSITAASAAAVLSFDLRDLFREIGTESQCEVMVFSCTCLIHTQLHLSVCIKMQMAARKRLQHKMLIKLLVMLPLAHCVCVI